MDLGIFGCGQLGWDGGGIYGERGWLGVSGAVVVPHSCGGMRCLRCTMW